MPLPTGTVTFLFSDIEGSTVRWEAHREAMQAALRRHDELMHVIIARHGGHVFKTVGDEFCTAFDRPTDAVAAAIEAQRAIAAEDWSNVDGLRVRMAMHSGVADERDGDYFGPTLNRVARLLGAGHGDQILVSNATAQLAGGTLPSETSLRDLGVHRLKDVPNPEAVFQIVAPGLRAEFPALRTVEANATNLPLQMTPFFGREQEVAEIESLLAESRLVTLTGSPGIGKTRAAQEIASRALPAYADGAWFVDLAPLTNSGGVPPALASALRLETSGQTSIEDLALSLKRKSLLVVLDNCEHVVEAAAACAHQLLQRCANVRILATSREALAVAAERTYRMPSLPEETAMRLFVDRARAVHARFELTAAGEPVVRDIVRRLDGIALAIELAASRTKALSLERIAKGLDERFKLLTGGSRSALPRQQTVRALIGWSYDLLTEAERSMLRQLAVFRGGWTLDAAVDVCSDERFDDWDAFTLLESLVEKSLVVAEPAGNETRYRMLESTRQYALERLREANEENGVARRHFDHFLKESEKSYGLFWRSNLSEWNALMLPEVENLQAAVRWSASGQVDASHRARLLANLAYSHFYELRNELASVYASLDDSVPPEVRGRLALARARLAVDAEPIPDVAREAADILEPVSLAEHVEALLYQNGALYKSGEVEQAVRAGARLTELARRTNVPRLAAIVLANTGLWSTVAGDPRGRHAIEESIALLRDVGDRTRLKMPLGDLGEALFAMGDAHGALAPALEALEIDRALGNAHLMILRNLNVAAYLLALCRRRDASRHVVEALELAAARDERLLAAVGVGHAAEIAAGSGDAERAATLLGYTNAAYAKARMVREPAERAGYERTMAEIRQALVPERLDELLMRGNALDHDTAIGAALTASRSVTHSEASAL